MDFTLYIHTSCVYTYIHIHIKRHIYIVCGSMSHYYCLHKIAYIQFLNMYFTWASADSLARKMKSIAQSCKSSWSRQLRESLPRGVGSTVTRNKESQSGWVNTNNPNMSLVYTIFIYKKYVYIHNIEHSYIYIYIILYIFFLVYQKLVERSENQLP